MSINFCAHSQTFHLGHRQQLFSCVQRGCQFCVLSSECYGLSKNQYLNTHTFCSSACTQRTSLFGTDCSIVWINFFKSLHRDLFFFLMLFRSATKACMAHKERLDHGPRKEMLLNKLPTSDLLSTDNFFSNTAMRSFCSRIVCTTVFH